jgi:hypothetical protein
MKASSARVRIQGVVFAPRILPPFEQAIAIGLLRGQTPRDTRLLT